MNISQFQDDRDSLLQELNRDPTLIERLYRIQDNNTTSQYPALNNEELRCLLKFNVCQLPGIQLFKLEGQSNKFLVTDSRSNYIIQALPIHDFEVQYRDQPIKYLEIRDSCGLSELDRLKFIGTSEFINDILIAFVLDYLSRLYSQFNLSTYLRYYTTTVINLPVPNILALRVDRYGLTLQEFTDLGSLDNMDPTFRQTYQEIKTITEPRLLETIDTDRIALSNRVDPKPLSQFRYQISVMTPKFVDTVIKQIIMTLSFLQDAVQFSHGDLRVTHILLKSEPLQANYRGLTVSTMFTCKLSDFREASLGLRLNSEPHRFYHRIWLLDRYLNSRLEFPVIQYQMDEPYYIIRQGYTPQIYQRTRSLGLGFYPSFDTYTFIMSFLLLPEVFYEVFTQPNLQMNYWDPLWFPEDNEKMFIRLHTLIQGRADNSLEVILTALWEVKLKCQVTTILLNQLKSM